MQLIAPAKPEITEKRDRYERNVALESLILRACGKDRAAWHAVTVWVRRWFFEPASLWTDEEGVWIAQPLRCHAVELDMVDSQLKKVLGRLEAQGLFEVTAKKLYPSALRKTTHLRPTALMLLFLHRIGWRKDPHSQTLEEQVGKDLDAFMEKTSTWPQSRLGTWPQSSLLMEDNKKEAISLFEKKIPAASQAAEKGQEVQSAKVIAMPLPTDAKKQPNTGFKGSTPPTPPGGLKPKPTSALSAIQGVLNKAPTTPSGGKQALWAKVAQLIHKTGQMFPIKAPPAAMARLWKMKEDVLLEYGSEQMFWDMIAAAAGDWPAFVGWMKANSSLVKGVPDTLDVLWLQFHRQKAIEYATTDGRGVAQAVFQGSYAGGVVQSLAQPVGTDLKKAGWNAQ